MTDYERRYLEERAAASDYTAALRARQFNNIRRRLDGVIIDDPAEVDRLAQNFAHAARCWLNAQIALGRSPPPELEAEAAGTL
jgi:hypothetical protein